VINDGNMQVEMRARKKLCAIERERRENECISDKAHLLIGKYIY